MLKALVTILRFLLIGFIYLGIRNIDIYYRMNNTKNFERYGDIFSLHKEDEITMILANINELRMECWNAKNNQVRDLILSAKVDIVAFQEVNIN